ncbi:MAG TPA: FHA domain-containing protein [Polyangiaceae bacterium]|nr:FHA domain-containing protein [Polyangiaceae bacterium]
MASRVAGLLRDRGRAPEAVAILSAFAAAYGNDAAGQALLAAALRIAPSSPLARMAFERMEGVQGDHAALNGAIERYSPDEILKLDRALRPGVFLKAQVGFNNNIKYKGAEYHVQTEDSGLDKPHIITHLFADGGRIIKSHKRGYASEVSRPDVSQFVRGLMKGQHMEMVLLLREGRFDEIVAGRAPGGIEVLEHPPKVDLDRIGKGASGGEKRSSTSSANINAPKAVFKVQAAPAAVAAPAAAKPAPAKDVLRARLFVTRSLHGGPESYEIRGDEAIIGAQGSVRLHGETFCHPKEAAFVWDEKQGQGTLTIVDLDGGNGVFLRAQRRVEIGLHDEFLVGDQLLRLERNPDPNDGPAPGPTYFRSSLKWPSAFRVMQILEGGAVGAVRMARGTTLQIGAALDYANDMVFRNDPLVAPYHCVIEEQAEAFILSDLADASAQEGVVKSGVFVRLHGRYQLRHGSELCVGRTRLLVDMSPSDPSLGPLG